MSPLALPLSHESGGRPGSSGRTPHRNLRDSVRRLRTGAARAGGLTDALVVAVAVTGCGGSSEATRTTDGGLTAVNVGVLAIGTQVPLYLGVEKGFFREEGLELNMHVAAGGSAIVPAVMRGSDQFGFANGASVVSAGAKGLPMKVVSGGEGAATEGNRDSDLSRVVVKADSDIHSPKDLEGKTISVSGLRDAPELLTRAALANQGVDVSKVRFQEIPYPDMLPALDAGHVDASYLVTPFGEQALADGDRTIIHPYYDTHPGLVTAYYFTSAAFAEQHPDTVSAFQRAVEKSMAYTNEHPDEARALLPSFTKIPKDIVPEVSFGHFPTTSAQAQGSLERVADLMVKFGFIKSAPDVARLMFSPPAGDA